MKLKSKFAINKKPNTIIKNKIDELLKSYNVYCKNSNNLFIDTSKYIKK